ncbi:hypothetical protein F5879DRAFT_1025906 [Lentinula edodes]|nr:hypothetical protein F5879DRAFT_1025906 [Lentinula edodes]
MYLRSSIENRRIHRKYDFHLSYPRFKVQNCKYLVYLNGIETYNNLEPKAFTISRKKLRKNQQDPGAMQLYDVLQVHDSPFYRSHSLSTSMSALSSFSIGGGISVEDRELTSELTFEKGDPCKKSYIMVEEESPNNTLFGYWCIWEGNGEFDDRSRYCPLSGVQLGRSPTSATVRSAEDHSGHQQERTMVSDYGTSSASHKELDRENWRVGTARARYCSMTSSRCLMLLDDVPSQPRRVIEAAADVEAFIS